MPEQIKEILQMRGLNLRPEAADVEEPETRRLINMDPSQKPGSLVVRRGKTHVGTQLSDDLVRAVARINGVRYQVAGRTLYREFDAIMGPYLAENEKTSFTAFRPLNDTVTWAFIGDDDWMMKDDGTRFYAWGIEEPLLPAPRVANQTLAVPGDTIETGTYTTAVTQIRFDNSNDI